jgi:hypothetical protein
MGSFPRLSDAICTGLSIPKYGLAGRGETAYMLA